MSNNIVEIWTDGSCKGNPGPGGWGAVLRYGKHEKEIYGGELITTNNRMELVAVIQALESLNRSVSVAITTDSQYVKRGMTEWINKWKKNGWRTGSSAVKNQDLWTKLDQLCSQHEVNWHWVKGHSGHAENSRADYLANRGVP